MPFSEWQISLAALWDTLTSLPLAFAVFSGLSVSFDY
jgi:predicted solute-binding protein